MAEKMISAKMAAKMVRTATAATRKAEEAKAQAHVKAFAARLIRDIAKAAGISPPPIEVRRRVMARGRKKAAAARKKAAAARSKARKTASAARAGKRS